MDLQQECLPYKVSLVMQVINFLKLFDTLKRLAKGPGGLKFNFYIVFINH